MNHLSPNKNIGPIFFFGLLFLNCFGCSGAKDDPRGERVGVTGMVFYDDEPIQNARILFISDTPQGKVKSAGIVRLGLFQIPQKGGPVIGEARVEIHPTTLELEELEQLQAEAKKEGKPFLDPTRIKIPAAYNKNSKLTAMVTKDGENEFEFKIKSK